MMKHVLEVSHLTKDYGSFQLDDVSFAIPGGTIMGLIGENGAGKSTTIKCILNLIHRNGGEIRILEKDSLQEEAAVKEELGVVLDESGYYNAFSPSQVDRIQQGLYPRWDSALFRRYLSKFALPEQTLVKDFSKGMRMKLALAAAFAVHPRLLILDEPTSGLDPVARDEILDEFLEFIQDETHGILISSHITSDLEKVADYVTYLHRGKVVVSGAKDELLDTYGRLVCTKAELAKVNPVLLAGIRTGQFGCQALVKDRRAFARLFPDLAVEPVSLEDIMIFTVKGDTQ